MNFEPEIFSKNNLYRGNFLCEELIVHIPEAWKRFPDLIQTNFHDFLLLSKIEFLTAKMSFPGKVMFYKVDPHKISHLNDSFLTIFEKRHGHFYANFRIGPPWHIRPFPVVKIKKLLQILVLHVAKPLTSKGIELGNKTFQSHYHSL
jgi:hypothetical protein